MDERFQLIGAGMVSSEELAARVLAVNEALMFSSEETASHILAVNEAMARDPGMQFIFGLFSILTGEEREGLG